LLLKQKVINISIAHYAWFAFVSKSGKAQKPLGSEIDVVSDEGRADNQHYYPTTLRRVQITPKTSKNITRYLYSKGPVRQVSCC